MEYDEQSPDRVAHRTHMRAMTEARQAAERANKASSRDPEARRTKAQGYRQELARINAEHQAWLRAHGIAAPPQLGRKPSRAS